MATGVPLTPQQLGDAARIYAETGNYSETARRLGLIESTVRKALGRTGSPNRSELHARACATAERIGRRALRRQVERLDRYLTEKVGDPRKGPLSPSIEPLEMAALEGKLSAAVKTTADLLDALDKRRTTRLSRTHTKAQTEKAKAETRFVEKRAQGLLSPEELLAELAREELLDVLAEVRRRRAQAAALKAAEPAEPAVSPNGPATQ